MANFYFLSTMMESHLEPEKLGAMMMILTLSLFAVSFPAISKEIPALRIPHVLFFIGKHFGTGVILSTTFCHLLQDAFESLQKPIVKERYHKLGKWTGLIILSSLLAIFLIEYISTTFVDYLHANSSVPSTPATSPRVSRSPSRRGLSPLSTAPPDNHLQVPNSLLLVHGSGSVPIHDDSTGEVRPTEVSPLLLTKRTQSLPRSHPHHPHSQISSPNISFEILTNSPRLAKCCLLETPATCVCKLPIDRQGLVPGSNAKSHSASHRQQRKPKVGRRRQIVGILVLQFGIMIHSLVIGLTLSITRGSEFTSLLIAILFHQLFEGLSLGIRIDTLPPIQGPFLSRRKSSSHSPVSRESTPLVDPELSNTSYAPPPHHEQKKKRSCWSALGNKLKAMNWLKAILSVLFGVTTPFGMAIGILAFPQGGHHDGNPTEQARMLLTQGLMSSISAGMLIYAATVEMLAGDFVFGDVSGGHSHHGGGASTHSHGYEGDLEVGHGDGGGSRGRELQGGEGSLRALQSHHHNDGEYDHRDRDRDDHDDVNHDDHEGTEHDYLHESDAHKQSTVGQKALAVVSLLAGVVVMNVTALLE
ncbi:hypothetical protein AMATHDRAFT_62735 [Amanita thiersii Skay4041]|uniref:Zinc/iron permease n=1 Tax=Amanita thiersii Skay4041 TaxID=703135 RepID=A0A2A9NPM8_9AGAR|nr:hypothetical protein AMATHDRAFT_62735 [Amanita thiersii Skay4041]